MPIMNTTLRRGFTLVELLVVIAIIGILSSIVVAGLNSARASSRDARRISDIKGIQVALSLYYNDNGQYPTALSSLVPTYISVIPKDPSTNADYKLSVYNANGTSNCTSNLPVRYHIGATTENLAGTALPSDDADYINAGTACTGSVARFHGGATDCSGTTSGTDNCYDVTN